MKMGLEPRLAALMKDAKQEERRKDISAAGMKLVDLGPHGMGRKFQVLALANHAEAPYPYSA